MIQRILLLAMVGMFSAGCLGERESTPNASGIFKNAGLQRVTRQEYRVDPPDLIAVTAPEVKEINGRQATVRPNGQITLPLIGDVQVAGLTPSEIADALSSKVAKFYKNEPEVRVDITPQSKFIYIFGFGAGKTGKIPYTGGVTVVSALAEAGFVVQAWPQQVRISRPARESNHDATVVVDFTKVWDYGNLSQNYLLEEGDVIFVPITPLAEWAEVTGELLAPLSNTFSLALTASSVSKR